MELRELKILSLNSRGTWTHSAPIFEITKDYDIVALLEQTLPKEQDKITQKIKYIEKQTNKKCLHASSTSKTQRASTIILYNIEIEPLITKKEILINENLIRLEITKDDYHYNLIFIYTPQKHKQNFFKTAFEKIQNLKDIIILGDWNATTDQDMQLTPRTRENIYVGHTLTTLLDNIQLIDIHELYNENKLKFTWRLNNYMARLDRAYTNKYTQRRITQYKILPNTFSDHDGIEIRIKWGKRNKWGKGLWKLNSKILQDDEYKQIIDNTIEIHRINKHFETDVLTHWDNLKKRIKKDSIDFSIQTQKETNKKNKIHTKHYI